MKIAELQSFLRNMSSFLAGAGGSSQLAKDFERMVQGLDPFQAQSVADFADFLARADEFARTGVVTARGGKARQPAQPRAPKKTSEEQVKEASQLVCALYEKALDPDFRYETMDQELQPILGLTAAQLKVVAKEFDIFKIPTKKADILGEIGRKIKGRREFHDRTRMNAAPTSDSMPATQPTV